MMRTIILTLIAICINFSAHCQDHFVVSDSMLTVGDEFSLQWNFPSATAVYISGIGLVQKEGSLAFKAERSTVLDAMVFEGDSIRAYHARVLVDGIRSAESCRSLGERGPVFTYALTKIRLEAALERIHQLLQDTLKFPIEKEYHLSGSESKFAFETQCIAPSYLISNDESDKGIAERRIAYTVQTELLPKAGKVNLEISCIIQYRRRALKTWRIDNDAERHQAEATRLKNLIIQNLSK